MTDQERLVDAIRDRLDPGGSLWLHALTDQEILDKTEGSAFRERIEFALAWEDFKAEIVKALPSWLRRWLTKLVS